MKTGLLDRNCYTLPPSHEVRIRELLAGQDSVYFFLQAGSRIEVTPCPGIPGKTGASKSTGISVQTAFGEYHSFIAGMGVRPASYPTFVAKMRQLGPMLGFKEATVTSASGSQESGYDGLMLKTA